MTPKFQVGDAVQYRSHVGDPVRHRFNQESVEGEVVYFYPVGLDPRKVLFYQVKDIDGACYVFAEHQLTSPTTPDESYITPNAPDELMFCVLKGLWLVAAFAFALRVLT